MKAVILAGGKGTRLAPYTRVFPKPMLPVGDKAVLEILLQQLHTAGIDEVILTVGHLAGLMRAFFQDGGTLGMRIRYAPEPHPLGTAGPLALIPGLDETFLVANGDILTTLDVRELAAFHRASGAAATIAAHRRTVHIDLGVLQSNGDHTLTGYIEKPDLEYKVSMGIYVFEPAALGYIPRGAYLDFPDLMQKMLAAGERVAIYDFDGYWKDLGSPGDYEQANADFESMRAQFLGEA